MINIAVVEDNTEDAKNLISCLTQYASQNLLQFQATHFTDAAPLLDSYKANYDLIFMDIKLPLMSGMEAAERLRKIDRSVTLVFVTNMVQYAIEGYAVQAFDYILKPISYHAFNLKLKRILAHVGSVGRERVVIRTEGETLGLDVRQIRYLEADGHYINWHTQDKVYRALGVLKTTAADLPASYCAISRWHMVNMQYVSSVVGNDVVLGGETLHIGRAYKQKFLQAYAEYMVGGREK